VVLSLALICIAQWAILYHCIITVDATWDDTRKECVLDQSNAIIFKVSYILVMVCDFVSLAFAAVGIRKENAGEPLFEAFAKDGLFLWVAPFVVNIFPVAFSLANLNIMMDIMTVAPASVISAIAACRLTIWKEDDDDESAAKLQMPASGGVIASRVVAKRAVAGSPNRYSFQVGANRTRPAEVRVITDHITTLHSIKDDELDSPTTDSVRDNDIKINVHVEEVVRANSEPV